MLVCKAMCFLHCANRTLAAAHLEIAAKGRAVPAGRGRCARASARRNGQRAEGSEHGKPFGKIYSQLLIFNAQFSTFDF